jgi:hypothetical protein
MPGGGEHGHQSFPESSVYPRGACARMRAFVFACVCVSLSLSLARALSLYLWNSRSFFASLFCVCMPLKCWRLHVDALPNVCVCVCVCVCFCVLVCVYVPFVRQARFKKFMTIMDSMTDEELDTVLSLSSLLKLPQTRTHFSNPPPLPLSLPASSHFHIPFPSPG